MRLLFVMFLLALSSCKTTGVLTKDIDAIDKQSKTKRRKDHYTVSWCYSCDDLNCIDLQIQLIDKGISQYTSTKNQSSFIESVINTKNKS